MSDSLAISFSDIEAAAGILERKAHRTPVMTSRHLDELASARLFFKCENLQRTGSFKFRGAMNALSSLDMEQRRRGVLTWSSGNHGQAIGLAGKILAIPRVVVMPRDAPGVKIAATRAYGAEVVLYDRFQVTREELGNRLANERGLTIVPPYDFPPVMAGQGTAAKELIDEVGELDYLYVCVGGGGLISGCATAAKHLSPQCQVIGVEPETGDDATRSFHSGVLQTVHNPDTIADGARTQSLGRHTFPVVMNLVDGMLTVTDAELIDGMKTIWQILKVVVEPTGALAFAGTMKSRNRFKPDSRVGIIVSGGNVDLHSIALYL